MLVLSLTADTSVVVMIAMARNWRRAGSETLHRFCLVIDTARKSNGKWRPSFLTLQAAVAHKGISALDEQGKVQDPSMSSSSLIRGSGSLVACSFFLGNEKSFQKHNSFVNDHVIVYNVTRQKEPRLLHICILLSHNVVSVWDFRVLSFVF